MRPPIDVLIVDDSAFVRRALRRILGEAPDEVRIVGEAADGEAALRLCQARSPRVVLLDLEMPVRDGLSTLEALMQLPEPPAVLVVSALAQPGAHRTLAALELGALDFVDKSSVGSMDVHRLGGELLAKLRAAAAHRPPPEPAAVPALNGHLLPDAIVIAASTGGPPALAALLHALPADLPAPVVIAQHMPAGFIPPFAERLATRTALAVQLATPGRSLLRGTVYVAPGGQHTALTRTAHGLSVVSRRAAADELAPSADVLFASAAAVCGARCFGIVLTGMGRDGAGGLLAIRTCGGLTFAQDRATAAVDGMPKAARDLGAAEVVAPLHELPRHLLLALAQARPSSPTFHAAPQEVAR